MYLFAFGIRHDHLVVLASQLWARLQDFGGQPVGDLHREGVVRELLAALVGYSRAIDQIEVVSRHS